MALGATVYSFKIELADSIAAFMCLWICALAISHFSNGRT